MQTVAVREKLHKMRRKYSDDASTRPCTRLSEGDAEKTLTIRKKLASLEGERCVRPRGRKDVTTTDQKITKQEERFTVYCRQKQR